MIKWLIWTIWTLMSSVLKKADKLNLSLSLSLWPLGDLDGLLKMQSLILQALTLSIIGLHSIRHVVLKIWCVLGQDLHAPDIWAWTYELALMWSPVLFHWLVACSGLVILLIGSINSSPPGAAYMHQWIWWAVVQIMAHRLFGAEPLSKPVLGYCQLDPQEQTSMIFESKYKAFHSRKCIWKHCLRNGGHFVRGRWVDDFVPSRNKPFTWANVDPDLCHHLASIGPQ